MSSLNRNDLKAAEQSKTVSAYNEAQSNQALNFQPKGLTKRRNFSKSPNVSRVNQIFENQTEENPLALKLKCNERFIRIREKQKEFKSVVAELLRLELLKTGIKREEISKL